MGWVFAGTIVVVGERGKARRGSLPVHVPNFHELMPCCQQRVLLHRNGREGSTVLNSVAVSTLREEECMRVNHMRRGSAYCT